MTRPSDMAMSFEAVLIGATKDKHGFVVKLAIHPSDVPDELVRDFVGTRYQIAAVKVADNGQPEGKKKERKRDEVQHAAILCKNPNFWKFMGCDSEAVAIDKLRINCGVESRSELSTEESSRRKFHDLVRRYEAWLE